MRNTRTVDAVSETQSHRERAEIRQFLIRSIGCREVTVSSRKRVQNMQSVPPLRYEQNTDMKDPKWLALTKGQKKLRLAKRKYRFHIKKPLQKKKQQIR
jgi:hypothetical protein